MYFIDLQRNQQHKLAAQVAQDSSKIAAQVSSAG
jgi:hypothetical protein